MRNLLCLFIISILAISCGTNSVNQSQLGKGENENYTDMLDAAEASATTSGRKILEVSRKMIADGEIIVGGCWDYINSIYERSGFNSKNRDIVFKSKLKGPYVKNETIESGDWLYFVNHSYGQGEHSAVFVAWVDEEKKDALMISYEGEGRKKPGYYKRYKLTHIYNIIRGASRP